MSMSLLLRTIKAFPSGKLAEELIFLLDKDCNPQQRIALFSELYDLEMQGLIRRGTDGKWKGDFFKFLEKDSASEAANSGSYIDAIPAVFSAISSPSSHERHRETRW